MTLDLTGSQFKELRDALLDAYRSKPKLSEMLRIKLGERLYAIASGDTLHEVVISLIDNAESDGWLEKLVTAAYDFNPGNPKLHEFYQKYVQNEPTAKAEIQNPTSDSMLPATKPPERRIENAEADTPISTPIKSTQPDRILAPVSSIPSNSTTRGASTIENSAVGRVDPNPIIYFRR